MSEAAADAAPAVDLTARTVARARVAADTATAVDTASRPAAALSRTAVDAAVAGDHGRRRGDAYRGAGRGEDSGRDPSIDAELSL